MGSNAVPTPLMQCIEFYKSYIKFKLLKALEYVSKCAQIPQSEFFASMDVNKALYLVLYYSCASRENPMAIFTARILAENLKTFSHELVIWLNQTFRPDPNHLRTVIYILRKLKSHFFEIPAHIMQVFKCHARHCGVNINDIFLLTIIENDNLPVKQDYMDIIQSNSFFPALLETFVNVFKTKLLRMFAYATGYSKYTLNYTGLMLFSPTPYFLIFLFGLICHDELACFLVLPLFSDPASRIVEDIEDIKPEDIATWLMTNFNFDNNVFNEALKTLDQLVVVQQMPSFLEEVLSAIKHPALDQNDNSKKVKREFKSQDIRKNKLLIKKLEEFLTFDLKLEVDRKLAGCAAMQPRVFIKSRDRVSLPYSSTSSRPIEGFSCCRILAEIGEETGWIPDENEKDVFQITNSVLDNAFVRTNDSVNTTIQKIMHLTFLSKGYPLPLSLNDLCSKCTLRVFHTITSVNRGSVGVPANSLILSRKTFKRKLNESFNLTNKADTKIAESTSMQPVVVVKTHPLPNTLSLPRSLTTSPPIDYECTSCSKILTEINEETGRIPDDKSKEILEITNNVLDARPVRTRASVNKIVKKIIHLTSLSKGYPMPLSFDNLCCKCALRIFYAFTSARRSSEGATINSMASSSNKNILIRKRKCQSLTTNKEQTSFSKRNLRNRASLQSPSLNETRYRTQRKTRGSQLPSKESTSFNDWWKIVRIPVTKKEKFPDLLLEMSEPVTGKQEIKPNQEIHKDV